MTCIPNSITARDLRRWHRRLEKIRPSLPASLMRMTGFEECFMAGEWLGEQLLALRLKPPAASDICFAHGQHCAMGKDPWEVAQQMLAESAAGHPPVPGAGLAESLLEEAGLGYDLEGMLDHFAQQGMSAEEMDVRVDQFREQPRYPPEEESGFRPDLFADLPHRKFPNLVADRLVHRYRLHLQETEREEKP